MSVSKHSFFTCLALASLTFASLPSAAPPSLTLTPASPPHLPPSPASHLDSTSLPSLFPLPVLSLGAPSLHFSSIPSFAPQEFLVQSFLVSLHLSLPFSLCVPSSPSLSILYFIYLLLIFFTRICFLSIFHPSLAPILT